MALAATRTRRTAVASPWLPGTLLAAVLGAAYVLAAPTSADLAAAQYRSALFARDGLQLWDNRWYGGHHLPGYSLLAPGLGALLTPRLLAGLSLVAATALFGGLSERLVGREGARWAVPLFALCVSAEAVAGRIPFALGVALALGSLLALVRRLAALACTLAVLASLASPVAGFFLSLIGVALVLAQPRRAERTGWPAGKRSMGAGRPAAVVASAALPVLALAFAFPEGGYEPFGLADLWPELAATLALTLLVASSGERARGQIRGWLVAGGLYALACCAAFAVHSPLGTNVTRLGPLVGAPLAAALLVTRRRWLTVAAAAAGLTWALVTPVYDLILVSGDRSVTVAYYRPLLAQLALRARGGPVRVEIPLTGAHWEAARVPGAVSLARGWERQLDTRYAHLFYARGLTAPAYHRWLSANAVAYVALPRVRLDYAARAEARLIGAGLTYLRPVWRSSDWQLYVVRDAAPLVSAPGVITRLDGAGFAFRAPRSGVYTVIVHFTRYWKLDRGSGCVTRAAGDWTRLSVLRAGVVHVGASFSLGRMLGAESHCR